MKKHYPNEVGTRYFKWVAKALANPTFSIGITIIFVVTPWISAFQTLEIFDDEVLKYLFIGILVIAIILVLLLPFFLRLSRFGLIKTEVINALNQLPIDKDTCIVGAGGGSFYLTGIILKNWQKNRGSNIPPASICVSLHFEDNDRKFSPSLEEIQTIINKKKILIVVTTIGTGKTARKMLDWANSIPSVQDINLFSLIISEDAAESGEWEDAYTLAVLNRNSMKKSIVPWIRTIK